MDYWYDCILDDATGRKTVVTYAYGMEIDRRSDDPSAAVPVVRSWTELMEEALPAIQADVDAYGIAAG